MLKKVNSFETPRSFPVITGLVPVISIR